MPVNWQTIREEFPALERWTFLNTAAFGQLPRRGQDAIARHLAHRDELACHDFLGWFDDMDAIRASVAQLIHASAGDIAFIGNASMGLSLFMGGIDWRPGDRIVSFEHEFPNNIYYPAVLGQGAVEHVQTNWAGLADALTDRTRLIAVSTVNYASGFRPPLEELAAMAHSRGIPLYLDGTQSVGALEIDVSRIKPAMLAVHGYKWLLSPVGAGFMYVSPELRARLKPNVIGWRSHRDWRNVNQLHHGAPEFVESAEKYEGGMVTFDVLYAMGESVRMMLKIGPEEIERRVMQLAADCRGRLQRLGAEVPECDAPILLAGFDPGIDVAALSLRLKERGILVSARHGRLRVSTHFYNNEADLDRLEAGLRELL